jgi:hypothetical protein
MGTAPLQSSWVIRLDLQPSGNKQKFAMTVERQPKGVDRPQYKPTLCTSTLKRHSELYLLIFWCRNMVHQLGLTVPSRHGRSRSRDVSAGRKYRNWFSIAISDIPLNRDIASD